MFGWNFLNKAPSRGRLKVAFFLFLLSLPALVCSQNGPKSEGELKELGAAVNSESEELAPVLNLEENVLYFTSDRPKEGDGSEDLDIYVSERGDDGRWEEARPVSFNSSGDEVSVGISADGEKLFFHRKGDLYKVERNKEGWSAPQAMGPAINSEHNEFHGSLSSDENTFYFVSDRSGDRDIYRVRTLPTGEWSKAQELSSPINTPEAENAPFIHPDGRTLFFSSVGHSEKGGPDIFYSKKNEKGGWATPINMGYPISTEGKNIHVMTSADGKRAYFASKSIEDGSEDRDLYRYDLQGSFTEGLAVLKGFVDVPAGSDLLDSVTVRIERPKGMEGSDRPWVQRPRRRDGVFIAVLPPCHEYSLSYFLGQEKKLEEELFIPCRSSYQKLRREVFMEPVEFDPSSLDRRPSLIGRLRHASNKAPVSKGTIKIIGKDGKEQDSVSIGPKGDFSFYHPSSEREGLLFRFEKKGSCQNTELELRSGGKTYPFKERNGCLYRFPSP